MSQEERHIITGCKKGNREAQKKLYDKYKIFLFGICMRYAHSTAEAEDVLQEGFFAILKDIKQFAYKSSIRGWMRKVMVNCALMHIRKYNKLKYTELDQEISIADSSESSIFKESDRAQFIIQLIRQLPLTHQTVFNLKAMDGYSFREISQLLDMPEGTLRSHYLRARKKLQFLLQEEMK